MKPKSKPKGKAKAKTAARKVDQASAEKGPEPSNEADNADKDKEPQAETKGQKKVVFARRPRPVTVPSCTKFDGLKAAWEKTFRCNYGRRSVIQI